MSTTEPFLEFTLYRVVRSMEPVEEDFWSYAKLGKPLLDPKKEASWKATSFWRTPGKRRSGVAMTSDGLLPRSGSERLTRTL
jgi:hypothetical protein